MSCRHGNPDDVCQNLDGSSEHADICPIDGERCTYGLEEGTYDRTVFPTSLSQENTSNGDNKQ